MPRPLALLFDLDGTIVDSVDLILHSFRHAFLTHVGSVPPDHAWIAGIGTPLPVQLATFTSDPELLQRLLGSYRSYQREHHDRLTRRFDGVLDTLTLLRDRGHPLGVVTSKVLELALRALDFAELGPLIDVVVAADMCARHKPDPEPVLLGLEQLGYAARDAIFVGDSPHDVLAGNAAGVTTVAALWGPFTRETLERASPTHLIETIGELPDLVERIQRRTTAGDA